MRNFRFLSGLAVAGLLAGSVVSGQQAKAPSKAAPAKAASGKAAAAPAGPVLVFEFAKGTVEMEMSPAEAPQSVQHVIGLVRSGFYRGQRLWYTSPALVEFGDPNMKDMTKRDMWGLGGSGKPVGVAEASLAKHKFVRGTVGLGYRTDFNPRTADSEITIIRGANTAMDGKYAVLGRVTSGMDVVDKLDVPDVIRNVYVKGEKK